jgi:hypothetical protein
VLKVLGLTIWVVSLLLHAPVTLAEQVPPHTVIGPETQYRLSTSAAVYTTDQQGIPLSRAVELYQQGEFSRPQTQGPSWTNFGLTRDEIWLAFELSTSSRIQENAFLEIGHPSLDRVDFYLLSDGDLLSQQQSGDLQPFSDRPVNHRNHVFPIALLPDSD